MANNQTEKLFLGIKQVKDATFNGLSASEKVGYLWFVSSGDSHENYQVYLGSKKYGETNEDLKKYIDQLISDITLAVGLTEDRELPEDFPFSSITEGVVALRDGLEELGETVDGVIEDLSGLSAYVVSELERLEEAIEANESAVTIAILTLRDRIGLDNNFDLPEKFLPYSSVTNAVWTEQEIIDYVNEKVAGAFHFKGSFELLSELISGDTAEKVEGNVYQVVYRDIEEVEVEGEFIWVPVVPPILINSEFAWNGEEWVELGPLFDDRELKQLREDLNELSGSVVERLDSVNIISEEFIRSLFLGELRDLIINVDGNYLTKTGEGRYHEGSVVQIGVTPVDGELFVRWSDGSKYNPRTVAVSENANDNIYTAITRSEESLGIIAPLVKVGQESKGHTSGGGNGLVGDSVSVSATRTARTKFKQWLDENEQVISTDNPGNVTITKSGETNVYAEFEDLNFDVILDNLQGFPYNSAYRVPHTKTESGVTIDTVYTHLIRTSGLTSTDTMNNRLGWDGNEYVNLLYKDSDPRDNRILVLCGRKSNDWDLYGGLGKISVHGDGTLDSLRFNYGYAYTGDRYEGTNRMPDLHLVVKIYDGNEEDTDNLVGSYEITRTYEEWGYVGEDEKILQRPFIFDSVEMNNGEMLNLQNGFFITIENHFEDEETPMVRTAIDNIELSTLLEETNNGDEPQPTE